MKTLFLAVVETSYTTYCIGETEEIAKRGALTAALKFLKQMGASREYKTIKDVDEWLGCNVFELELNRGRQEY